MADLTIHIVHLKQQTIYGLWKDSNDKTVSKDIISLSKKYYATVSLPRKKAIPYFILSKHYNEQSKNFKMLIGSTVNKDGLNSFNFLLVNMQGLQLNQSLVIYGGFLLVRRRDFFTPNGYLKALLKP